MAATDIPNTSTQSSLCPVLPFPPLTLYAIVRAMDCKIYRYCPRQNAPLEMVKASARKPSYLSALASPKNIKLVKCTHPRFGKGTIHQFADGMDSRRSLPRWFLDSKQYQSSLLYGRKGIDVDTALQELVRTDRHEE